jgi:predicted TIM-barrel fold metal-dependent hydrolase
MVQNEEATVVMEAQRAVVSSRKSTDHVVFVSSDSHVGPTFDQLRLYCPKEHLDEFDAFANTCIAAANPSEGQFGYDPASAAEELRKTTRRNALTPGGWEVDVRLREMDYDGVAAEVIYHGSVPGFPIPFDGFFGFNAGADKDPKMVALGRHIYNQWLADFCSAAPDRLIGMAQLPMWDIELATKELEWAAAAGLRGVNFPRPQPGIVAYNDPRWDSFWSACESLDMSLNTHAQGSPSESSDENSSPFDLGVGGAAIVGLDVTHSRMALQYFIFGAVFERHPHLKLVFTEQPGEWWMQTMNELDSLYICHASMAGIDWKTPNPITGNLSKLPSQYANEQLFVGATCLARFEADNAIRDGYTSRLMWGRDYPHFEGSYQYPRFDGEPSWNRLHLLDTFGGLPDEATAQMAGETAASVYGLDINALRQIAEKIGAPTFGDLDERPDLDLEPVSPDGARLSFYAFRRQGPYN